jgi:hypothetical protein
MAPQEAADRGLLFTSQVAEVNAKRLIANDPIKAAALLADPTASAQAFPGLLPERASSLAGEASFKAMRVENRNNAAVAHQDAMARLNEEATLRANEVGVLADIADGKPMDRAAIDEAGRKGMFSPGGFMVIQGQLARQREGTDNTMTGLHLYAALGARTLTGADITTAALAGQHGDQGISGKTALDLLKALDEQSKTAATAAYSAGLAQVRQAFNAAAAERGQFGKDEAGEAQIAMVTQAEYAQRAGVLHQDPTATANDIVAKYQIPPSALQTVGTDFVSSSADLQRVRSADQDAVRTGTMDQPTYEGRMVQLDRLAAMLNARGGVPLPMQKAAAAVKTPEQYRRDANGPQTPSSPLLPADTAAPPYVPQ